MKKEPAFNQMALILLLSLLFAVSLFSPAQAETLVMLGLGDSIGEGVQSADASLRTQSFSYLKFIGRQIGVNLRSPWIESGPVGWVGDTTNRTRLFPHISGLNLAVSGADVNSLLNDQADALSVDEINSETDLVLFPRLGSQVEIAESLMPPLTVCWIGNNDVLSAAISFDQLDASQLTPVDQFTADFNEIVQRLGDLGGAVIFANIPDVTNIGFLVDRQDLIHFLGSDFGLAEGDFTSIVVMLLIRLGLDDGSLLNDPNFILDAEEVQMIQERIDAFNLIIEDAAAVIGVPVVDINALYDAIDSNPPQILGTPITTRFLGGIFSLDGVHPSNIGHAIIANTFISTINDHFNSSIPEISVEDRIKIFLTDPFVDKDGDGVVKGRPLAGLLETLGPQLGISGDINDFDPDVSGVPAEAGLRGEVIERFLSRQGKEPHIASLRDIGGFMEFFRIVLGSITSNKTVRR
jgi:lysophospholipase L1-like esterase